MDRQDELREAVEALSVKELEGVLDALTLVADYYDATPTEGLYLVPPYGELIASGDMKCFAKARDDERLIGSRILVSGHKAYGIVTVDDPVKVSAGEFDSLCGSEHCVSRKDRLRWWPEKESLYLYPITMTSRYESPREVDLPPGTNTVMEEVSFLDSKGVDTGSQPVPLSITIASTPTQAEKGFSNRDVIDPSEGILIPLQPTTGIWMKDTYVPLTVAFLDSDYKVLSMVDLIPEDETIHLGPRGSVWALEASPPWFASASVEVGDHIALEDHHASPLS